MYEELVKSLRQCAEASCAGCKNDLVEIGCRGKLQIEGADAIEELSGLVDRYGGETGIKNLQEYANKYWDLLKNAPRWIPVTDGLPRADETDSRGFVVPYLVMNGYKRVTARRAENYWVLYGEGLVLKNVTHWMPLPEPPKEETIS